MAGQTPPNIAKGLVSRLLALSTDKMPQSEVVPFLQSIVDAGAVKAVPYAIQNLIRFYIRLGDVTPSPTQVEEPWLSSLSSDTVVRY